MNLETFYDKLKDAMNFLGLKWGDMKLASIHTREVLVMANTALLEHGTPYLHHELRYQEAIDAARAALKGGK